MVSVDTRPSVYMKSYWVFTGTIYLCPSMAGLMVMIHIHTAYPPPFRDWSDGMVTILALKLIQHLGLVYSLYIWYYQSGIECSAGKLMSL